MQKDCPKSCVLEFCSKHYYDVIMSVTLWFCLQCSCKKCL